MQEIQKENFNQQLKQHEKIIYHLIHKLRIRDNDKELYQEGLIALWRASRTYDEAKGKFSTYAYFLIEKALISLIHTKNNQAKIEALLLANTDRDQLYTSQEVGFDPYLLASIQSELTPKQWKWFQLFILEDLSICEIATREQVTIDAVKNWARLAKPKLQKLLTK